MYYLSFSSTIVTIVILYRTDHQNSEGVAASLDAVCHRAAKQEVLEVPVGAIMTLCWVFKWLVRPYPCRTRCRAFKRKIFRRPAALP